MGKPKGGSNINTPLKGQISRYYQRLGGDSVRGSATATAKKFNLKGSGAAALVKKIDEQVASGKASRVNRRSSGRPSGFNEEMEAAIEGVFEEDETATYREAAEKLDLPAKTLHNYATKNMDYRCLGTTIRPLPSEINRQKRVDSAKEIIAVDGPVKNKFHQDEKWYICNTKRRKRKKRRSDKKVV